MEVFIAVAASIGGFILFWIVLSGVISYLTGWLWLSRAFASRDRVDGVRFFWTSVALRSMWSSYNNAVTVTIGEDALSLTMAFFFRTFHPRLVIPFMLIHDVREKKGPFSVTNYVVEISDPATKLFFGKKVGKAIQDKWLQSRGKTPYYTPL